MIRKLHGDIRTRVMSFMYSQNKFLLLKLPTGAGKTVTTLMTVEELSDNWIYLCPFHNVIEESLTSSSFKNFKFVHLKSRARMCIIPKWRDLAIKHVNIRPICENRCQLKESGCPYYEAKKKLLSEPQSWAGVHHHISGFLNDFLYYEDEEHKRMYTNYSVLIIDENPINVFFINEKATGSQLLDLKLLIEKLDINNAYTRDCIKFLEFLVMNFITKGELDYNILYKLFSKVDFDSFYEAYQIELLEAIIDGRVDEEKIPKSFIMWFSKIQNHSSRDKIENMIVKREKSDYTKKHYYLMCFEENALKNIPLKIIALDGTANVDIWESLIGKEASIFDKSYDYENIYQLNTGEYPLSSWLVPRTYEVRNTGQRLCNLIDKVASKKKFDVLVVCTKSLQPHIKKHTKAKNLIYGYYYYLRSRNDFYRTADTVILACQPNIPEFQISCFSMLSQWGSDIWRQIFTDEEMMQGIGRIREALKVVAETKRKREKVEIYVFPAPRSESFPTIHIVDIFGKWVGGKRLNYEQMEYFIDTGLLPKDIDKVILEKLLTSIPEDGIYWNTLKKNFRKEYKINEMEFRRIFNTSELKRNGKKKIYPRLA